MIPRPRAPQDDEPDWAHTAALTDQARTGDRHAFGELYRLHYDAVFRFTYYRVSSREQAEDIVADAFLRAMRSIENFTWVAGGFIGWMLTIARNLIADLFKSSRYRREVSTGEMLDRGLAPGPEDVVLGRQADAEIHAAVDSLNPLQRACIQARFLDELTHAETAERLGRNEGAVKTLQYRAVRTLGRDSRLTPEHTA
jgi:RNA polymerase sigma-70 factor (ECF subfamily)